MQQERKIADGTAMMQPFNCVKACCTFFAPQASSASQRKKTIHTKKTGTRPVWFYDSSIL